MSNEARYTRRRQRMVAEQLEGRGISDTRVLDAFRRVPRHHFIARGDEGKAYQDRPLRIGAEQTISQPYIVALMTELLALRGDEKVLEIGTGSGYQAAILSVLARQVYTIECQADLAEQAAARFAAMGIKNVQVHPGDGSLGLKAQAPFDAIMVTAAAPEVPLPLLEQLADSGRLVLPVGDASSQVLERWQRDGTTMRREVIVPVAFVPLLGSQGWDKADWLASRGE